MIDKTPAQCESICTSEIIRRIQAPAETPLRVDFAGGWLDVPRFARPGAAVVNCAISPMVSLRNWPYERYAGLGGSGAWSLLNGCCGVNEELAAGVGWQDPAVISETGCCVWRSGPAPELEFKRCGRFLDGRMALYWTGQRHDSASCASFSRDYALIEQAAAVARRAVHEEDVDLLCQAVELSYEAQLSEGMLPLPESEGSTGPQVLR